MPPMMSGMDGFAAGVWQDARGRVAVVLAVAVLAAGCGLIGDKGPPMRFDHPNRSGPAVPLVVYIHGGGWSGGDRLSDGYYALAKVRLLAQGIAVASIDYRLAPKNRFPAQIVDAAYAVRYLRKNAKKMKIDPDRIAAFGTSAGGHLASLLGTVDSPGGFDVGALKDVSSRVKAVVSIAGPVDLSDSAFPPATDAGIQAAFGVPGGTAGHPALVQGSPSTYVSPGDAPFLIVHGTQDELVPYSQSVNFARLLQTAGVRAELVTVRGGNHALTMPGQEPDPSGITERISTFLVTELRR
jgi:acetyl esterase/lipase